jgi:hypothetical protein
MVSSTALIDSDLLVYAIGFVFDESVSERVVMNKVDTRIEGIMNAARCNTNICFITRPRDNFRYDVATIGKYKGNRLQSKPFYYEFIRDYLKHEHSAIESSGCEADDTIADAMVNSRESSVVCSLDKDLDTIYGWHFKWGIRGKQGKGLHYIAPHEAHRFLCKQMLMGDSSDNILGVYGIGSKKAESILNRCEDDYMQAVKQTYRDIYGDSIKYQTWRGEWIERTYLELLRENWELLFIGGGQDRIRNRERWFGRGT